MAPDSAIVEGQLEPSSGPPAVPDELQIHYIKSNFYRVIYAEGAWGGFSPAGRMVINFYSQRVPIPLAETHAVNPDGTLGPLKKSEGKAGLVREVEVAVTLDIDNARALVNWLNERITLYDQVAKK